MKEKLFCMQNEKITAIPENPHEKRKNISSKNFLYQNCFLLGSAM